MASPKFLHRLASLAREGTSFVVATVVARKAPVSAHLGDAAIIFEDGRIEGYIGGGCSQEILRAQAFLALRSGEPRLVRISPDTIASPPGYPGAGDGEPAQYVRVRMTCASQGALDLYVEPYVSTPLLIVAGASPIALATAKLGSFLGFEVRVVCDPAEPTLESGGAFETLSPETLTGFLDALPEQRREQQLFGVVASMGEYDDVALDALLRAKAGYIALVASKRRCEAVMSALLAHGWSSADLAAIRNPAGLDIGAKTGAEVALSVMAEIVSSRRRKTAATEVSGQATDPACAHHKAQSVEHDSTP